MAPQLVPLQQWVCDTCGELIEKPNDGYLEWLKDDANHAYGFRVVHRATKSPRRNKGRDCYYSKDESSADGELDWYLGTDGMVELLHWIDEGAEFDEKYPGPRALHLREWTTLFRRLHLPYFEEARRYLADARSGNFSDCNQISFYQKDTLKQIIEMYSEEN